MTGFSDYLDVFLIRLRQVSSSYVSLVGKLLFWFEITSFQLLLNARQGLVVLLTGIGCGNVCDEVHFTFFVGCLSDMGLVTYP